MILRLPWAAIRGLRKPPLNLLDTSVLRMRVLPHDIDTYGHVNNGRFLTLMDIGRTDIAARTGMIRLFRTQRWLPVVAGATVRYRRELRPLRRYTLSTRIVGWDDEWFFFEQHLDDAEGNLAARAYLKIAVLDEQRKRISTAPTVQALAPDVDTPPLPEGVRAWQLSDVS